MRRLYTAKSKKVALVIKHWAFGLMEQCNDLLEYPPNNSFSMPYSQCLKQPLLNQLYIFIYLDFRLVVAVTLSIVHDVKLH